MRILLIFIALLSWLTSNGQDAFEKGNEKYTEEHYKTALKEYESLIDSSNQASNIYYNLGNAYYKTKKLGKAIWAYESALKIDPKNEDAKFNLEFSNLQTKDKIEQPEPAITEWLQRLLFGPRINLWAYVSIGCSFLLSIALLVFFTTKSRQRRNLSLMGGMTITLLLVFSTTTAYFHKKSILSNNEGIVVAEKVEVRLSPLPKANVSFDLHEGAKINVLDNSDGWLHIEVNGNEGWVEEDAIWLI